MTAVATAIAAAGTAIVRTRTAVVGKLLLPVRGRIVASRTRVATTALGGRRVTVVIVGTVVTVIVGITPREVKGLGKLGTN